ncbi:hypothetical protein MKX01_025684 [Papaver californicum]|nr:hypothetical protein MKX01_025684 [Papaver californicum]
MESENRSTSYRRSGSELFICFTSRSSSSLKVCSKSTQSPGRNSGKFSNSSSSSVSCSLSRRLRSNGSIKGSPMFPTGSQKKKGSSSETTAEPSSPKVTCIGQVRVKTKKQGQKFRKKKSKRRDASFRKTDDGSFHSQPLQQQQQQQQECLPHRSQRWVHLPLSICDALRAFGAEFSCLLPCKPSCLTRGMKKRRQPSSTDRNTSSCRQIFEKWVMTSLNESEHQNRDNHNNETELVVSRREDGMRRGRRDEEVVGEIEIHISEEKRVSVYNEEEEAVEVEAEEEEEEGRVSICIPPRNALLLMRCRSEPLRMSALANHFWESPVKDKKEDDDLQHRKQLLVAEEDDSDSGSDEEEVEDGEEEKDSDDDEVEDETEVKLQLKNPPIEDKSRKKEENTDISMEENQEEEENRDKPEEIVVKKIEEDVNESGYSVVHPLKEEEEEHEILKVEDNEEEPRLQMREEEKELIVELKEERIETKRPSTSSRRASFSACTRSIHEDEEEEEAEEKEQIPEAEPVKVFVFEEKVNIATEEKATKPRTSVEKGGTMKINNRNNNKEEDLPDCLLLMMCEPKLSMEVSKETWVCSTDFIRCRPERRVVQNNGGGDHDHSKKRNSTDSKGRHSLDSKNRLSTDSKSRLSTDSNPGNGRPPLHTKHQKPPTPPRRSISKPTLPSVAKSMTPAPPLPPAKLVPPVEVATSSPPLPPAKLVPPVEVATSSSAMASMIEKKLVNAVAYEPLVLTRCNSDPMRSSAKLAPEACFWKNMKLEPHTQGPPNLGVGAATGIGF